MSKKMKDITFDTVSYDSWKEHAIKALKGKPFESLLTKISEGITLQPLYTQESLLEKLGDELEKQVATIRTLRDDNTYQIAQQVYATSSAAFFAGLADSLQRGNEVITIDSRVAFAWDEQTLLKLSQYLTEYSFKIRVQNAEDTLLQVFTHIDETQRDKVSGIIICDTAEIQLAGYDNVRTIGAITEPYHYQGATAVQELALALAVAAKYAEKEQDFASFAAKFYASFAVDTQFFIEIAKLRAFKVLWKAFTAAYGVEDDVIVPVIAETSVRSYSKYDVYVNLLRGANEALSAAIGGVDYFTVHPHDVLTQPTEQSARIARNVSLVLKEETHVLRVVDPAGGSYFIETLTADFVTEAWVLFLEIEDAGGIDSFTQSGALQKMLDEAYVARLQQVETRKHSLIGTNIYANPDDKAATENNPALTAIKRFAQPFEALRATYTEQNIEIAILTYGALKDFKPRADFVSGIVNTVGAVAQQSGALTTIEAAQQWLQQTTADYVVVAATNDAMVEIMPALLATKPSNSIIDVAGKFAQQDEWQQQGLNGAVYAGQNIIEKLTAVLASVKEVK